MRQDRSRTPCRGAIWRIEFCAGRFDWSFAAGAGRQFWIRRRVEGATLQQARQLAPLLGEHSLGLGLSSKCDSPVWLTVLTALQRGMQANQDDPDDGESRPNPRTWPKPFAPPGEPGFEPVVFITRRRG